jgi:hypothetical protein
MTRMQTRHFIHFSLLTALVVCAGSAAHAAGVQQTFATPQEAGQALIAAAEHNDTEGMLKLFGPQGKDIVVSGDTAEDKAGRADFAARAHENMQVNQDHTNPDRAILVIGNDEWPFPVPLVRGKDGKWSFDSAQGKFEVLARRVGRNELNVIDVCRGYVEAQMEYSARDRDKRGMLEYAQKIISTPGKQDGLYWEGESENLAPKAFADAAAAMLLQEGKKPQPYHGYYFHILKAQGPEAPGGALNYVVKGEMIGGFALIAWPAEYGVTGVHTFIVSHHGVVYERDLGASTSTAARAITAFNPEKGWKRVEGE